MKGIIINCQKRGYIDVSKRKIDELLKKIEQVQIFIYLYIDLRQEQRDPNGQ